MMQSQAMYDKVVEFIRKPSSERQMTDVTLFCQFLALKLSSTFQSVTKEVMEDIVRNCEFTETSFDNIIIRQGDIGDCFYVLLFGRASVYINTEMNAEGDEENTFVQSHSETKMGQKKPLDRSKYGTYILTYDAGKSFGELALINPNCIRNATIIADQKCHLLVVSRELYNRSLKSAQEAEYRAKEEFVQNNPLFSSWKPRYKTQAAFSLRKESLHFNTPIVSQGEKVNGLAFITKGQAKIVVDVFQHCRQYPDLNLHSFDGKHSACKRSQTSSYSRLESSSMQYMDSKRGSGGRGYSYARAEQRNSMKNVEVSLVGAGEVIGDLEKTFQLTTYCKSFIVTMATDVFILDEENFQRLIHPKKNPQTLVLLSEMAYMKVSSRILRNVEQPLPLVQYCENEILLRKKKQEDMDAARTKRLSSVSSTSLTVLPTSLNLSGTTRGPIIDLYGPGTVFHRNRMRRKEKESLEKKRKEALRKSAKGDDEEKNPSADKSHDKSNRNNPISGKVSSMSYMKSKRSAMDSGSSPAAISDWEVNSQRLMNLEERLRNWHATMSQLGVDQTSGTPIMQSKD